MEKANSQKKFLSLGTLHVPRMLLRYNPSKRLPALCEFLILTECPQDWSV